MRDDDKTGPDTEPALGEERHASGLDLCEDRTGRKRPMTMAQSPSVHRQEMVGSPDR